MNPVVVDSSVAFKWLHHLDEPNVDTANALLDEHERGSVLITAPAGLHAELANALRYSSLPQDEVLKLIDSLGEYRIELVSATPARLGAAVRLSYHHGMSVYDGLFLALAEELGCPLVTADRRAFAGIETPVEIRLL